ncbi:MAG: PstS family phosphate ABC transporter substrate-binding protein [Desulfobulbaceae bacterium]|nr:PstS family phosphate ABC transporter substrate-binding protein [Desulfobulbaceae bacterium]
MNNTLGKFIWLLGLSWLLLVSGCSDRTDQGNTAEKPSAAGRYLTIKGSDTMVHLVSSWAEQFMADFPDVDLSVTGGGSGTGIAALLNGTTDICAASRKIKEKEMQIAAAKGINPVEFSVALDGIAVVVNPTNPVEELTIEELGKIFTGMINNWQQVGGPDKPIILLSRESSSGTFVFFQERVLAKKDYSDKALFMPGTSAIINNTITDKWSIGYVGLGYTRDAKDKVKIINVAERLGSPAITPSEKSVKDGSYPIARPLFLYVNDKHAKTTQDFIDFALGEAGQETVRQAGYVKIK